jgi:two-component system, cell cycle sensor histidine kinase and response regulator CckA
MVIPVARKRVVNATTTQANEHPALLLEAAIQHIEYMILIAEADEQQLPRILFANDCAIRTTGYTISDVIGQPLTFLCGHATNPTLMSQLQHLSNQHPIIAEGLTYPIHGMPFYAEWNVTPMPTIEGEPARWVAVIHDITAQRRTQELRWQREKIESLGTLAGGIAHDFNNLLAVILGNASMALSELPNDSALREMLVPIEAAALQAADLTRQMMTYAGLDRLRTQAFDLNYVIEDLCTTLIGSLGSDIHIETDLAPDLPVILADVGQIRRALRNLLINAAESIGAASGTISVQTRVMDVSADYIHSTHLAPELPTGLYICLSIRDTGIGMDGDTIARAFEPFFTTKFIGRGLGMAEVFGIVSAHQGTIKLESKIGQGTTCEVLLPILFAA